MLAAVTIEWTPCTYSLFPSGYSFLSVVSKKWRDNFTVGGLLSWGRGLLPALKEKTTSGDVRRCPTNQVKIMKPKYQSTISEGEKSPASSLAPRNTPLHSFPYWSRAQVVPMCRVHERSQWGTERGGKEMRRRISGLSVWVVFVHVVMIFIRIFSLVLLSPP